MAFLSKNKQTNKKQKTKKQKNCFFSPHIVKNQHISPETAYFFFKHGFQCKYASEANETIKIKSM